jgi:predicted DNA-binding transcriptional regulator AlpA
MTENDNPRDLDERIRAACKGPRQRKRNVSEIVTDTETDLPSAPRGGDEQRWPPSRGPPELWRLPKVLATTGLRQTQLLDAVARGTFPKPVKILEGGRANAWVSAEVIEHILERIAARDSEGER